MYKIIQKPFILSVVISIMYLSACQSGNDTPPNIVFVLADQWRAMDLGYAGNPQVHTPNFDKLAGESINFVNAVSTTPVCSPTRASLLTGQYPLTHGVFHNDKPLPDEALTFAEILKGKGYVTGYIGKWHVNGHAKGENVRDGRTRPVPKERRQGFDYWKVHECTHDYNQSLYFDEENNEHQWEGYDAFSQTDSAIQFIEKNKDKTFLLYLSWGPPHNPYQTAPEKYVKMVDSVGIALRPNVPDTLAAIAVKELKGYYAHIAALDDAMGRLQETIQKAGIENNTLFIFTSDHGDMIHSQGMVRKQKPWDESVRVPFLLKYPKLLGKSGREERKPIGTVDVMPTMLGLAGVESPGTVQGINFSAYLKGDSALSVEGAMIMLPVPFHEWTYRKGGRDYRGIRSERYTYAITHDGPWLLYDNEKDPWQQHNLVDSGELEHVEIREKLAKALAKLMSRANDEFLTGHEYMKRWNYDWDNLDSLKSDMPVSE